MTQMHPDRKVCLSNTYLPNSKRSHFSFRTTKKIQTITILL